MFAFRKESFRARFALHRDIPLQLFFIYNNQKKREHLFFFFLKIFTQKFFQIRLPKVKNQLCQHDSNIIDCADIQIMEQKNSKFRSDSIIFVQKNHKFYDILLLFLSQ